MTQIINNAKELEKELEKEVLNILENPIVIPSFEDIQKKSSLYKEYGDTVMRNQRVNDLLIKSSKISLSLKDLVKSFKVTGDFPLSIANMYRARIDDIQSKLHDYNKMLSYEKDSIDAALRFYSSAQYILSSPRLMGMD